MDFRTRVQWGAVFNPVNVPTFPTPVDRLFIHHNVMAPTSDPNADMRATEQVDINRFGTPSYKYAIHPTGVVLEGMTNHWSPDTYQYNDKLSIMFMGNFEVDHPTPAAILACRELIQTLKNDGMLLPNALIQGHRDVYPTACPGANLYPIIGVLASPPPAPPPKPKPTPPVVVRKDDNMVLEDPTTNGVWVVDELGEVFAYDGAPYLGGLNNDKMNPKKFTCTGIARHHDAHGEGYCLLLDFGTAGNTGDRFRRYRFPRDGSSKV